MNKETNETNTIVREFEPAPVIGGSRRAVRVDGAAAADRRRHNRPARRNSASDWWPAVTRPGPRRPNLLIAGASGHVAQAFLQRLVQRRTDFGRVVFVDPDEGVLRDAHLDHDKLDYEFVGCRISLPDDLAHYHQLLRRHEIDIVLDLTDLDTMPILTATDAAGVS